MGRDVKRWVIHAVDARCGRQALCNGREGQEWECTVVPQRGGQQQPIPLTGLLWQSAPVADSGRVRDDLSSHTGEDELPRHLTALLCALEAACTVPHHLLPTGAVCTVQGQRGKLAQAWLVSSKMACFPGMQEHRAVCVTAD